MGQPFGLDYTAVMMIGAAIGADGELLADVLPWVEAAVLARFRDDDAAADQ